MTLNKLAPGRANGHRALGEHDAPDGTTRALHLQQPGGGTLAAPDMLQAAMGAHSIQLTRLLELLGRVRSVGRGFMARCPAHEDQNPSLSVRDGKVGVLVHCHAGCTTTSVLAAVNLTIANLFFDNRFSLRGRRRPVLFRPSPRTNADFAQEVHLGVLHQSDTHLDSIAHQLGLVDGRGLRRLDAYWATGARALALPMRNAEGQVVGIRYRAHDARKWAATGSQNGLFLPVDLDAKQLVVVTEGATDTAAVLSLGMEAVGLASASHRGSIESLGRLLHGAEVVVLGDNDEPGRRSADQVATHLLAHARSVRIAFPPPPLNDGREWVKSGASRDDLLRAFQVPPVRVRFLEANT